MKYSLDYFTHGPYKGVKIAGLSRYFGKYYWARRFYAKLISDLTPESGRILEIGCGFGDLLVFLEDKFSTFGIDVSGDAIIEAKKRLKNTKLSVLKAEKTDSFSRNFFSTVIACHILEHLPDPKLAIKSVGRILKKGGVFFIVVPNTDSLGRKLKKGNWVGYRDKTHISLYEPQKWFKLLQRGGFSIEKTFGDGLWDSPYIPIIPPIIQRLFFGLPAIIQISLTVPFIPIYLGESAVIIARKT